MEKKEKNALKESRRTKIIVLSLLLLVVFSINLCSSQLIYQVNTNIDLKVPCLNNGTWCSVAAVCNITITRPNGTIMVDNQRMTNQGSFHNYTLSNTSTSDLGSYPSVVSCTDTGLNGYNAFEFTITGNGKQEPSGIVIVLFSIFFLLTVGAAGYLTIYSIGHLMSLDFDIMDMAYDWGVYFVIVGGYFLQSFYVGNPSLDSWFLLLVKFAWLPLMLIPMIAFILSITIGTLQKKRINVNVARQRRW